MFNYLKNLKANYTLSAILCVVIGLVLIIWPGTSTQLVCMVLGSVLLLYGLVQLALYLFAKERTLYLQGMLVLGIIFSVLGIWILLKPEIVIATVPIIIGIIIVIHGIHKITQAVNLSRMNYDNWWVALLFGILTVVLGGVLIYNPFSVVNTVVRVIGAFLLYDGLSNMWILSRVFKTKRDIDRVVDVDGRWVDEEK